MYDNLKTIYEPRVRDGAAIPGWVELIKAVLAGFRYA